MIAYDAHPLRNAGLLSLNTEIANVFFLQRQYAKAEELLGSAEDVARTHNMLPQGGDNPGFRGGTFLLLGTIARAQGQPGKARSYFEAARVNSEAWLTKNPQQATIYEARAAARIAANDAALGRKEQALQEAQHVSKLWPITRNAVVATDIAPTLATAYLWAGDRESALRLLHQFATLPGGPTAGDLKLNPVWDELRGDSRFNKIVQSAAQPTAIN
jgi:tetratricopeptide (TPR) repeat protein